MTASSDQDPILEPFIRFAHAVSDPIIITKSDLDSPGPEIVYVNPAFERITKYSLQEVAGKTPRILQGQKSDPEVLDRLRSELEENQKFYGKIVNYDRDGNELLFEWHISAIYDHQGEVAYWASVQHEIGKSKSTAESSRISAIVVAENHLVCSGIRTYLGRVATRVRVYEAYNYEEARNIALETGDSDIVILDIDADTLGSPGEIEEVAKAVDPAPLVVITSRTDFDSISSYFDIGVKGVVPRSASGDALLEIMKLILAGGTYVPWPSLSSEQSARKPSASDPALDAKIAKLTNRQREVVALVAQGHSNEQIRQKLGITLTTVKIHVSRALKTLEVTNRVQAALLLRDRPL